MERRKKILVLLFLFSIGIIIAFRAPIKSDEGVRRKVVQGGIIGGPVSIGGGRISVKKENKNGSVKINSSGIYPSTLNMSTGAFLSISNNDPNTNHRVGFYGEKKSAVLKPEYTYRITMTSKGEYEFYVEFEDGSKRGTVKVK